MASSPQMSFITPLIFIILLSSFPPLSSSSSSSPFKQVYAFGDSYTDTGNTRTSKGPIAFNYVSNPPYGVTFFHHPTNRYSDGRIVLDFLAEALGLPFLPPYRNPKADRSHGVNFAVGGATAIQHGFFLKNNVSFNLVPRSTLQIQLSWFNKIMEGKGCKDSKTTPRECKDALGDALIWLGEIGANDYTCSLGSSIPSQTIQNLAVKNVFGFLQAVLNKGAKYIIVQGLPPTGCITYSFALSSPDDRDEMGCVASVNRKCSSHNAALQQRLVVLRKQNPQSVILFADYYDALLTVLKSAEKYGFKEHIKACCGYGGEPYNYNVFNPCGSPSSSSCPTPSDYVNWDGAHLTEAANRIILNSFLNGSECRPPFQYLLRQKLRSG